MIIRGYTAFVFTLLMVYLTGAFVRATFDVSLWPMPMRIVLAIIGVVGAIVVKQITTHGRYNK